MLSVAGYPAGNISFCPRCGSSDITYSNHWKGDGNLRCNCGCSVIIIENDDNEEGE